MRKRVSGKLLTLKTAIKIQFMNFKIKDFMNILKDALSPISIQDNSLSFWKEKLTNISPINLPTDYIRPACSW